MSPEYRADIEDICEAEMRSGALQVPEGRARQMKVAEWLGPALETREARKFLASLGSKAPAEKGNALRAEATRVGLPGCALAEIWK